MNEIEIFLDWGYSPNKTGILNWFEFEEGESPIRPALKALKIKDDLAESNSVVGWVNDRVTQYNGETYNATGAKYFTVANAFDRSEVQLYSMSTIRLTNSSDPRLVEIQSLLPSLRTKASS